MRFIMRFIMVLTSKKLPDDIKNGIRKRPDRTRSLRLCNVEPSNGSAPHTKTYSTTPSDFK